MSNKTAGNIVYDEVLGNTVLALSHKEARDLLCDICFDFFEYKDGYDVNGFDDSRTSNDHAIDVMLLLLDVAIQENDLNKFKSTVIKHVKSFIGDD